MGSSVKLSPSCLCRRNRIVLYWQSNVVAKPYLDRRMSLMMCIMNPVCFFHLSLTSPSSPQFNWNGMEIHPSEIRQCGWVLLFIAYSRAYSFFFLLSDSSAMFLFINTSGRGKARKYWGPERSWEDEWIGGFTSLLNLWRRQFNNFCKGSARLWVAADWHVNQNREQHQTYWEFRGNFRSCFLDTWLTSFSRLSLLDNDCC